MLEVAYKALLRTPDGKLLSSGVYGEYETEYTPGERTERERLFVFRYINDAKTYAKGINEVWSVEVDSEDVRPAPEKILNSEDVEDYYEKFWFDPDWFARTFPEHMQFAPEGSYNCNALTLIEKVWDQSNG